MKKLGIALGSGGARGLFHLGVLKSLEENNIRPDFIAGSSIGALVGAMYASGQTHEEIYKRIKGYKAEIALSFIDFVMFKGGLLKGRKLKKLVRKFVGVSDFADLKIPFAAVATNLVDGKSYTIENGDLIGAIMASMAVPSVYKPVRLDGKILVDGGVSNPVPDDVAKAMGAEVVLATNLDYALHRFGKENKYKLSMNVGLRSFDLYRHYLAEFSTSTADIILNPELEDNSFIGINTLKSESKSQKVIQLGEQLMDKEISNLLSLLV